MIVEMNCIEISSPVVRTFRNMNQRRMNNIDCFRMLSVVPCRNVSRPDPFYFRHLQIENLQILVP